MNKKISLFSLGILFGMSILLIFQTLFGFADGIYLNYFSQKGKKVNQILSFLDKYYIGEYDEKKLEEYMYTGLVLGLNDPYTSYLDKNTYENFMKDTKGMFTGIGISVSVDSTDNNIVIISTHEGFPGAKAGLLPQDKILKIDNIPVSGEDLQAAIDLIGKGTIGTTVKITILRESDNRLYDFEILREKIEMPTVSHKILENNIGYIRITTFDQVTSDQFKSAYNDLQSKNIGGLIIDLRNNPGGLLNVVVEISDLLIPEGNVLYTVTKSGHRENYKSGPDKIEIPLVVIVNKNSASASEVLSGAVKDTGVGVLVGTKTYGKGVVQNLFKLFDNSALKITMAKYYTPNSISIDGTGIIPDYIVEMDDVLSSKIQSLSLEEDTQLLKSIEIINQKLGN